MPGGLQVEFLEETAPAGAVPAIPQLIGDPYAIAGLWAALWLLVTLALAVVFVGRLARDWRWRRDAEGAFALLRKTRYFIQ